MGWNLFVELFRVVLIQNINELALLSTIGLYPCIKSQASLHWYQDKVSISRKNKTIGLKVKIWWHAFVPNMQDKEGQHAT